MKNFLTYILCLLLCFSCQHSNKKQSDRFNKATIDSLANELNTMAIMDQLATSASYPYGEYSSLNNREWRLFKDSIKRANQRKLEKIVNKFGYPGYNMVGHKASLNFWLMVEHSNHAPAFQQKVLEKMKPEVDKNNASASDFGKLTDIVKINMGLEQIYGTQVKYNTRNCQAYPMPLKDSLHVNDRRKAIGLPPLEEYLNRMSKLYFEANKAKYLSLGVKGPKLYQSHKNTPET